MPLTLRPTVIGNDLLKNDYSVIHEGRSVGRIRLAEERASQGEVWEWHVNPPLPIPPWCNGSAKNFESAKDAFRAAWERFYASLSQTILRAGIVPRTWQSGRETEKRPHPG